MAGISDKALKGNYAENKYRFTGQLYDDDLDWDTYQMKYRTMDPQLGRFWQIDPLAKDYVYNSTYDYAENRVTNGIDLEGAEYFSVTSSEATTIAHAVNPKVVTEQSVKVAEATDKAANQINAKVAPVIGIGIIGFTNPALGIPLALTWLTGVPVTPAPQAMAGSLGTGGIPMVEEAGGTTATEDGVTLYRGVNENHPGYEDALNGTVSPRGGNATPAEHNEGNTNSPYTSWTTNPDVAENYALRPTGSGAVLQTTVSKSSTVASPSGKWVNLKQSPGTVVNEAEVLLTGRIDQIQYRPVTPK